MNSTIANTASISRSTLDYSIPTLTSPIVPTGSPVIIMDLNDSISKLSESLSQYSAAALMNVSLPEFDGQQDVKMFMDKFKRATVALNDDLKCLAFSRSLVGPAKVWSKSIKEHIKSGDWTEVKKQVNKRFSTQDESLKHLGKLQKMRYNPDETTLTSYVEVFANTYKKAHPASEPTDVIRGLRVNLTPDIVRHLNTLSEKWTEFKTLNEFYALVRRLELDILPFEQSSKASQKDDLASLTNAIKEIQGHIIKLSTDKKDDNPKSVPVEVMAAISQPNQYRYDRRDIKRPRIDSQQGYQSRNYYNKGITQNPSQQIPDVLSDLQRKYEEQHGKPPGPCRMCGALHFHRHCPFQAKN